jgi:hypothetical protein
MRAVVSVGPPLVYPTTRRIGLDGKLCAIEFGAARLAHAMIAADNRITPRRWLCMISLFVSG